jgi:uncharacterized protein (TIGR00251 family)
MPCDGLLPGPHAARRVPWQDAVLENRDGCRLLLEATPGARRAAFPAGFDPWRGRIGIKVAAPPRGGRANAEVVEAVAAYFGLAASCVSIAGGGGDRRKAVDLPLGRDVVLARLSVGLEDA